MITVLGADGFIGSQLVRKLVTDGVDHQAIGRNDPLPGGNLGDVIYCIGLTADFRTRLLQTVESHVCYLLDLVRGQEFNSLLYLSSTRVYAGSDSTNEEESLLVKPQSQDDLYNLSKVMGESVVLNCGRHTRVARISNVYGPDFNSENFLSTILRQSVNSEEIVLETAPDSAKDYVNVSDVVDGLIKLATAGRERIYNLGSGLNVSHTELTQKLQDLTGCVVEFAPNAPTVQFPPINIQRMRHEFNFAPSFILDDLVHLVPLYRKSRTRNLREE